MISLIRLAGRALVILHIAVLPAPGFAQSGGHTGHGAMPAANTAPGVSIVMPWSRATPPGAKVAGGFLMLENSGVSDDRLIGGTFEAVGSVEVHEMATVNGVMSMRALDKGLNVPAGGKVELKPGGYHLMFIGLKKPFKDGEAVAGELLFEKAGKVPVTFKVMPLGSTGAHQHH